MRARAQASDACCAEGTADTNKVNCDADGQLQEGLGPNHRETWDAAEQLQAPCNDCYRQGRPRLECVESKECNSDGAGVLQGVLQNVLLHFGEWTILQSDQHRPDSRAAVQVRRIPHRRCSAHRRGVQLARQPVHRRTAHAGRRAPQGGADGQRQRPAAVHGTVVKG